MFTFIFVLVLMALILGYGIKSLMTLREAGRDVELGDFFLRLRDEVEQMFSFDVGSSKDVELFLPENAELVCFYDSDEEITLGELDEVIASYLEGHPGVNVFVTPFSFAQSSLWIEHLRGGGQENPLCFEAEDRLRIGLRTVVGKDGKVYVEVTR